MVVSRLSFHEPDNRYAQEAIPSSQSYSTCGNPQPESGIALAKKPVARAVTANSREPKWDEAKKPPVQASSPKLQQMPLGVIHLSETWEVLEYRREGDDSAQQDTPLGQAFVLSGSLDQKRRVCKYAQVRH